MVDYRKFLKTEAEEVAALYLGGLTAHAPGGRTLRLRTLPEVAHGTYRFEVTGRYAKLLEATERLDLSSLPRETGHFVAGYLAMPQGRFEPLELLDAPEPEVLSPVRARRHETGALVLEEGLFEGESEAAAREALDEGRGIDAVKGVSPSLRSAYAFAMVLASARPQGVGVSPAEIAKRVPTISSGGRGAATEILEELVRSRAQEQARADAHRRDAQVRELVGRARAAARARRNEAALDPVERAERALHAAGARLLGARRLGADTLEVRFQFMAERFMSVVHPETLHVFDAGICLAGADEEVTLESLPSVIREAIEDGALVITRW